MKVIKTIKKENETIKFYNQPLNGGESVRIGGRQYWMIREYNNLNENQTLGFGKSNIREKKCNNCSRVMSVSQFYSDSYSVSGYSSWCKSCCKNHHNKRKEELKLVA